MVTGNLKSDLNPASESRSDSSGRMPAMPVTKPGKILLVRFSALGDVIQTLPILTMLRDGFPDAKIGWAIDTELAPAIEGHPALDYVHRCSRRSWSRALSNPGKWPQAAREFRGLSMRCEAVHYDVSIDAQGLLKTALLPYMAGVKQRIGFRHGREFSSVFYTERHLHRANISIRRSVIWSTWRTWRTALALAMCATRLSRRV